jgi:hypothetical protein
MEDGAATPIGLLYKHFENENLPPPKSLTKTEMEEVAERIKELNQEELP